MSVRTHEEIDGEYQLVAQAPAIRKEDLELRHRIKWLAFVRVILISLLMAGTLAVHFLGEKPIDVLSLRALFLVISAIFIASIIYGICLTVQVSLILQARVQFAFDALFATAIIFVSGGVESIFTFFYIFIIFGAAIMLGRGWALITASLSGILYGTLVDLQFYGLIDPFPLYGTSHGAYDASRIFYIILSNFFAFYVVALLGSYFQDQLAKARVKLSQQSRDMMELEALNDRIVESINSGLLTLDLNGRILSFNSAAGKILGYRFEEVYQHHVTDVLPGLEEFIAQEEGRAYGLRSRGEVSFEFPARKPLRLGFSFSPLTSVDGDEIGNIMIFQDITEIKKMQDEVKHLERLALMGTLTAGMAHEIKNPLGAMSGAFQMLRQEEPGSPIARRLTGIIEREMNRLNELLNEFLWLSRPGKTESTFKTALLEKLIDDTITLVRSKHNLNGEVKIKKRIPADFTVFVDESHFRQVIWNLVLNAVEAVEGRGEVEISAERVSIDGPEGGHVPYARVSFGDTGSGIPEHVRARLFEPFYTTKDQGTGLGLAIVQRIIDTHHGRIEVETPEAGGTLFSLYLPESQSSSS